MPSLERTNITGEAHATFVQRLLPPSPVGRGLVSGPRARLATAAIAVAVLTMDLSRHDAAYGTRLPLPLAGLGLLWLLARDPAMTLGARGRPLPSWRWWTFATRLVAGLHTVVHAAFWAWMAASGPRLDISLQVGRIEDLPAAAWRVCVLAPIVEELVYRAVLVPALLPALGPWGAIAASGVAFATLHHVYGNPGPDNQVAGFVLAWAYLRSGAVWVPVALHALGNACVLISHVGLAEGWWRLPGVAA